MAGHRTRRSAIAPARRWKRSDTATSDLRVRRAVDRDLDTLVGLWSDLSIHHHSVDAAFAMRSGSEASVRRLVAAMLRDPDGALFVGEDSQRETLGFVAVRVDRAPPILVESERAEITDLLVVEGARRRGVGRTLVDRALAWVSDRGLERCEVRVAAANPEGQGFWRALGFGDLMDVLQRRL